jgi:hypothetical protein
MANFHGEGIDPSLETCYQSMEIKMKYNDVDKRCEHEGKGISFFTKYPNISNHIKNLITKGQLKEPETILHCRSRENGECSITNTSCKKEEGFKEAGHSIVANENIERSDILIAMSFAERSKVLGRIKKLLHS